MNATEDNSALLEEKRTTGTGVDKQKTSINWINPFTTEGMKYMHLAKSKFWQNLKVQSLIRYRTSLAI